MSATDFRSRRHKPRRDVEARIEVTDCMTGQVVGRIGNLSESGMLLLVDTPLQAEAPLRAEALYQLQFDLASVVAGTDPVRVGAQVLWLDSSDGQGRTWAGLHFIHLPAGQRRRLQAWIDRGAG